VGQFSEADWIGLAADHGVEHRSSALAEYIGQLRFDLNVGILDRPVDTLRGPAACGSAAATRSCCV
jgi:hypothetical protein